MTETGILIAGFLVSITVFTGVFLYGMVTINRRVDRKDSQRTGPREMWKKTEG